jgi:hypothetical protein
MYWLSVTRPGRTDRPPFWKPVTKRTTGGISTPATLAIVPVLVMQPASTPARKPIWSSANSKLVTFARPPSLV